MILDCHLLRLDLKAFQGLSIAASKKHQHITCRAGSWDSHSLRLPWLRKCYLACVCREGVGSSWERRLSMSLQYLISYLFQFNSSIQKHRVHWELFSRTGPTHLDFSCLLFLSYYRAFTTVSELLRLEIAPHTLRAEFRTTPTATVHMLTVHRAIQFSRYKMKGPAKSGCAFLCDMCDRDAATYP